MKHNKCWIAVGAACLSMASQWAMAHGTVTEPPSRIYQCYLEGPESLSSAACQALKASDGTNGMYTWNAVAQGGANDNHRSVVPDGKLCSGNAAGYSGLDLTRDDWVATPVTAGSYTFNWTNTAPHTTAYYDYYITRNGYDPLQPLKWDDLEFIYRAGPSASASTSAHTFDLPMRSGKHVVYSVWQRQVDLSTEAFYACVDVDFSGGGSSSSSSSGSSSSGGSSSGGSSSGGSSGSSSGGSMDLCASTPVWQSGNAYVAGTQVQQNGDKFEANWWTLDEPASHSGPWDAWTNIGACLVGGGSSSSSSGGSSSSGSGGSSSGASGSSSGSSSGGSSGGGSCSSPAYSAGNSYSANDLVQNLGSEYVCVVAGWCSQGGAYEPGAGWAWDDAWDLVQACQ